MRGVARPRHELGIPMGYATLADRFHAVVEKLKPLYKRLLALVARSDIVQADETSVKMQRPPKRGFVWAFLSGELIAYRLLVVVRARRRSTCWAAPGPATEASPHFLNRFISAIGP
jgi:hypothetical protein